MSHKRKEKSGRKYIRLSCQTGIKHEIYPNANNRANIYEKKYNYEEMLFLTKEPAPTMMSSPTEMQLASTD